MKGVFNLFKYQNNAQMREKNPEEELKEAFRVFDAEGTGVIGEQRKIMLRMNMVVVNKAVVKMVDVKMAVVKMTVKD